jgi:hypothetical protein
MIKVTRLLPPVGPRPTRKSGRHVRLMTIAISSPVTLETWRLGTLEFANGFRDKDPGEKVYENLDFHPRVQSFLTAMPRASLSAVRNGCRSFGP